MLYVIYVYTHRYEWQQWKKWAVTVNSNMCHQGYIYMRYETICIHLTAPFEIDYYIEEMFYKSKDSRVTHASLARSRSLSIFLCSEWLNVYEFVCVYDCYMPCTNTFHIMWLVVYRNLWGTEMMCSNARVLHENNYFLLVNGIRWQYRMSAHSTRR